MLRLTYLLLAFVVSACIVAPASTETPVPTATLLPNTETPTPTTVWFPPTATFTPMPTATVAAPTPEQRPDVGEVIFQDDFSDPDNWWLSHSSTGSVALGINELTIAIPEGRKYLASVRSEPTLKDFYAEITTSPTLCRGMDEYGFLFRYASLGDFYRFSLSCDGQVRLDRVLAGQVSTPYPWELGAMIPVGAPSFSRIGVWVVGKEMHFFVNDQFQFSVSDGTIPAGRIGVFARATGDGPVTINFSDLVVRSVNP